MQIASPNGLGCFSYYEISSLHFEAPYKNVLKRHLKPDLENHFSIGSNCIFRDDSAPLKTLKKGIETLEWLKKAQILTL